MTQNGLQHSEHPDDRLQADSLPPVSARETLRYISQLAGQDGPGQRPRHLTGRRYRVWLLLTALATVFAIQAAAQLMGFVVDIFNGDALPIVGRNVQAVIVLVGVALLVEAGGRALMYYLIMGKARLLSVDLRRQALRSVLQAPVPDMTALGTGNIITRLTKDIDEAVNVAAMIGVRLFITVFIFPITVVSIAVIHPIYLLTFLAASLVVIPMLKYVVRILPATANMVSSVEATRNNLMLDTLRGLPTLRAFNLGDWSLRRMETTSWDAVRATARRVPIFTRVLASGYVTYGTLLIGTIALSIWLFHSGQVSAGAATAATVLIVRLEIHVFNLLFFAGEIQQAQVGLGRAVALAHMQQHQPADDVADLSEPPTIAIRNVGFRYRESATILEGLTLNLQAGSTTALVGASGAGKSTLAALIAGLLEPTSGEIRVGGVNIGEVSSNWTARNVTLISQEVHVFSGTLRADLRLAAPAAQDEQLYLALERAGLARGSAAFSRAFPAGLDTLVGAGHDDLDPEVTQQIALARVILRNPPVLLMDEATAEAGSEHARALEEAASAVAKGRTCLVVAHRLDQARGADRILVMDQGRIVEDGTHDELIAAGQQYASLYRSWEQGR